MNKIPISEGKRLHEKYAAPVVIVFTLLDGGNTFNVMTYGANKRLCRVAANFADQIAVKVLDGTIAPEEIESEHLPDQPTNWAGIRTQD